MPIGIPELKLLLEKPKNRRAIEDARKREELIRFHSQVNFSEFENAFALRDFIDGFVYKLVRDLTQYNRYRTMLQFPVCTNPLLSEIYGAWWKIFEGKDKSYAADFLTPTAEEDWHDYRKVWELDRFWQHKAWEEFKCYCESYIVTDLAKEQTTTLPEPYPCFVRITSVIDFSHKESPGEWEELEYIIFRTDATHVSFFDTLSYQVFETKENSNELIKETLNNPHNLGFCPVTKLVHGEHPVLRYLTSLKKLLFSILGQDIIDFSIANPMWWVYEQDCTFNDEQTGDTCDGGFLKNDTGDYILTGDRQLMECPKCKGRFMGHGTVLELPIPSENEKGLGVPAGVVVTPVDNLKYGTEHLKERREEIYFGLVGQGSAPPSDKAVNTDQVRSLRESTEDKLNHLQRITFERAQQRTEATMAKLRQGNNFVSLSLSYGSTHYIDKPEDVLVSYQDARTKGDSDSILDGIYENYILLKYKNNPEQLQRENILWNLEPFHHRSNAEVREMFRNFECDFNEYYIKINFSTLIARFERENMSVLEFASALSFPKKIEAIYKTLESYAEAIQSTNEERRKQRAAEESAGNGSGNPFEKQPA